MRKKEKISEFVPTNMAVNFVQHNRCKLYMCACRERMSKKEKIS